MKDIAIYGAGGFGTEVACIISKINEVSETGPIWNILGFFDDNKGVAPNKYGSYLGGIEELNTWSNPINIVIAIGTPKTVESIVNKVYNPFVSYPNIIAPTSTFYDLETLQLGKGNVIGFNCVISKNVMIGNFNVFNNIITIGHEVKVGCFNTFMPGVRISGEVTVGNRNFFGVNSGIIQRKTVGDDVIVGAGSMLFRNPKNGYTYLGVPAKKLEY